MVVGKRFYRMLSTKVAYHLSSEREEIFTRHSAGG